MYNCKKKEVDVRVHKHNIDIQSIIYFILNKYEKKPMKLLIMKMYNSKKKLKKDVENVNDHNI